MKEKLLLIACTMAAAICVMVLHEFAKAFAFFCTQKDKRKFLSIFKFHRYIDPVGMIFSIATLSAFSRPYGYSIGRKKTNVVVGFAGFGSLVFMILGGVLFFRSYFAGFIYDGIYSPLETRILYYFTYYFVILAISMLIINFFPVSTFDVSILIAAYYPEKYFGLIYADMLTKGVLLVSILLGLVGNASVFIANYFMNVG
ncbi:MAG: hypothetical protein IJA10_00685 [Lachnospiraceae bacterium]|nr:hypothetical protein [Lachnospiraceae bacterium]